MPCGDLWGTSTALCRSSSISSRSDADWALRNPGGLANETCDFDQMILSDKKSWLVVFSPTPLKNDGLSNSWDDEIPNWMEKYKIHVPNHQPDRAEPLEKPWKT